MVEFSVKNVKVYGLEETAIASGLPMSTGSYDKEFRQKDLERLCRLGSVEAGSAHDCALKGITVQMDVTAPQYWWPQFQRYHFADFVSSQSKMHRIMEFDIGDRCNEYVEQEAIDRINRLVKEYKKDQTDENFLKVLSNTPLGFHLTARITTNYLQLKSMHKQRRHHRLPEWQHFCDWIESLPYFNELVFEGKTGRES